MDFNDFEVGLAGKNEHRYGDGDIIFREGEASEAAFLLVEGGVALTKTGDKGPVTLARIGAGEMFGEMSLLDEGPRSATAHAVGDVSLKVIPRDEFLNALAQEPETARAVMGKLAERLRSANELVARGGAPAHTQASTKGAAQNGKQSGGGLLAKLFGFKSGGPRSERIEIRVANLAGDLGGEHSKSIVTALSRRRGIRVRYLDRTVELDPDQDLTGNTDAQLPALAVEARQILVRNKADLLIWGEIPAPGPTMRLRFVSRFPEDEDEPGFFGLATHFNIPVGFERRLGDILAAVVFAATAPTSEGKSMTLRDNLPRTADSAAAIIAELPSELTSLERASLQACFANVLAVTAARGFADHFDNAEQAYRSALETISRDSGPLEWALLQKNLGAVLQARSERTNDTALMEAAVDCYRQALQVLSLNLFPRAWASAQNRVGLILYKLDLQTGDSELVKHALASFQAALQVYTRSETPQRWAEVMGNVAQAALMLGEQLRNEEILLKAANACRGVLQVRTRESAPLPWAATQNNLGSALYLLGRLRKSGETLEGASQAFSQARDVYREFAATKLVAVTEKNLARVESLHAKLGNRAVPKMSWEDETAP